MVRQPDALAASRTDHQVMTIGKPHRFGAADFHHGKRFISRADFSRYVEKPTIDLTPNT